MRARLQYWTDRGWYTSVYGPERWNEVIAGSEGRQRRYRIVDEKGFAVREWFPSTTSAASSGA
jgi:hypothetical protein